MKKRLIVILLISIILTSCAKKENTVVRTAPEKQQDETIVLTDPVISYEDDEAIRVEVIETPVSLGEKQLADFVDYIDNLEVTYEYNKLFELENARRSRQAYQKPTVHSLDVRNPQGNIDLDDFVAKVIQNSQEYYENLNSQKSFYNQVDEEEIRYICSIILEYVFKAQQVLDIDMDEISCKLANLKILLKKGSASLASVNQDGVLSYNPNMIHVGEYIASEQDVKRDSIIHEAMHILQYYCCDEEPRKLFGVGYLDESLQINSLNWKWYLEAAAEKAMTDFTGDPLITYPAPIGYMESLALSGILSEKNHVHEMEYFSLQRNFGAFLSYFDLPESEIEQMMYAIEIIQSESEEFKTQYELEFSEELTEQKLIEIKRILKGSICLSLSKQFYRNLAVSVYSNKPTAEDICYLIKVFEADLFNHLRYDNAQKKDLIPGFFATYKKIQDLFFGGLEWEQKKVESFDTFFARYSTQVIYGDSLISPNCTFQWLPREKVEYLAERKAVLYSRDISAIRDEI